MEYKNLHPWNVDIKEAIKIQEGLRKRIILKNRIKKLENVAATDVGFLKDKAKGVVCIFDFSTLKLIEFNTAIKTIDFPYIPGFLSFYEGPVILEAFEKTKNIPDLILFDGHGICHPRRMGLATHLGIILDIPSIGCAKDLFFGVFDMPSINKGSFSYIYDKYNKEILGIALRTQTNIKPIFVSCGYKIDLDTAKDIVIKLTKKFRIPEPLRIAHHLSKIVG